MSHEKIRSIVIKDNKVFVNGACNNLRPLDYHVWECSSLTKILQEDGREAVEIEILKTYEEGSFQGGSNKYTKALKILKYVFGEEYKKFDWRKGTGLEHERIKNRRETWNFTLLLKKTLAYEFPKEKYIISKDYFGQKVYMKKCISSAYWTKFKEEAKKFDFKEEAEDKKGCYSVGGEWEVEKY